MVYNEAPRCGLFAEKTVVVGILLPWLVSDPDVIALEL